MTSPPAARTRHEIVTKFWLHRKSHHYKIAVVWSADGSEGTKNYRAYSRNHTISADGKPAILASSDPPFRGDASRYNPEELLVASLSACHMLWYLHPCAVSGVTVLHYDDAAVGTVEENADGSGRFSRVELHPAVTISRESDPHEAQSLHERAHELCFIARSVNFPVVVAPAVKATDDGPRSR
jgi:organic hydroperoxide reductase OsmC/OhrA